MFIPVFKKFIAFVVIRLCAENCWSEKKIFLTGRFGNFAQKSNSATNAIEFYLYDFLESIPYVWTQEDLFRRAYKQTNTTKRPVRKFLTNLMGQLSNRRLDSKVLETKIEKWLRYAVPKAWLCIYTFSRNFKNVHIKYFCVPRTLNSISLWNAVYPSSSWNELTEIFFRHYPRGSHRATGGALTTLNLDWEGSRTDGDKSWKLNSRGNDSTSSHIYATFLILKNNP